MGERSNDKANVAGMCLHGNFPSHCPQCGVKTRQEHYSSHEVEAYVSECVQKEISPEQKTELNKELASVMDFFAAAGIETYIAGGTGIDLLDEEWNRDHQDLDVAIMGSNRQKFFDVATREGYLITDPDRRSLSQEEIVSPETHNAFLFRSNEQGFTQFEVIFLNETPTGDVALTKRAAALRTTYAQAPKVNVAGREITLQPPDVILFHKLTDGRRKDFRDAKKVWDTLQDEQCERVVDYLEKAGVRFAIDGVEMTDIPSLFVAAERKDAELHRDFFDKKVDGLEIELTHELMAKCEEVFAIRQGVAEQSAFFEELAAKYEGFMPERRVVLEAMADYLYQSPPPAIDAFKMWAKQLVKSDDRVKQRALHEYVSEKLWEVKID